MMYAEGKRPCHFAYLHAGDGPGCMSEACLLPDAFDKRRRVLHYVGLVVDFVPISPYPQRLSRVRWNLERRRDKARLVGARRWQWRYVASPPISGLSVMQARAMA